MEINTNKTCAADTMKQQIENAQKATGEYPIKPNFIHSGAMWSILLSCFSDR